MSALSLFVGHTKSQPPSPQSKESESPPSPLPPVSVFGPNKFSPAPPITSSYFLSGTVLRKQSELRVRGGLDSQQLTRQEAEGELQTNTWTHMQPLVTSNICSLIPAACLRKTVIAVCRNVHSFCVELMRRSFQIWTQSHIFFPL